MDGWTSFLAFVLIMLVENGGLKQVDPITAAKCRLQHLHLLCFSTHLFKFLLCHLSISPVYMLYIFIDYRFKVYTLCTFQRLSHPAVPDSRQSTGPASQWRAAGWRRLHTAHKHVGGSESFGNMPATTRWPTPQLCSHIDVADPHALHTHAHTIFIAIICKHIGQANFNVMQYEFGCYHHKWTTSLNGVFNCVNLP